jgi:catechol 2,3-dioxygenase-like lactoylglutathione lyase family enzyme
MSNTDTVRFQRANYVVTDLDRALVLYRDILGMTVEFMHDSEPDSYSYPVFEIDKQAQLRFCVLNTATQPRVMALTEIMGIEFPATPMPRRAAIVLAVPNIDEVLAGCAKADFHVYPEEQLVTHDGRTGREIGIVDDDGNLIVIYHIETHP